MSAPVVDPELVLPVRHEAIARRVAELVTAELAPAMIPATLAPGVLEPMWEWLRDCARGRMSYYVSPCAFGPHILQMLVSVDAERRSLELTMDANGARLWAGSLRDRRPSV